MSYSLTVEVPLIYTDPNRLSGRDWRTRHSRYERVKNTVAMATTGKKPKEPLKKFKLKFVRKGPGFLDWDNLIASLKPYIDGLTLAGIIKDDNWTYIKHIDVDQEKSEDHSVIMHVVECKSHTALNKKAAKNAV